jgi:hypothetical protein
MERLGVKSLSEGIITMPVIAPIIGAAGAIGGAIIGSHKTKAQNEALQTQTAIEKFGLQTAQKDIPAGEQALGQSLAYYTPLLTGNRQAMMEAEGPQISTLAQNYMNAKKNISQFGPRGGGTTSALAQAPFNLADQITQLLEGARTNAATQVANIGSSLANIGVSAMNTSAATAGTVASQQLQQQQQTNQLLGSLGAALGKIVSTGSSPGSKGTDWGLLANIISTDQAGNVIPVGQEAPIAG